MTDDIVERLCLIENAGKEAIKEIERLRALLKAAAQEQRDALRAIRTGDAKTARLILEGKAH